MHTLLGFGVGLPEVVIILVVVLLIFGPAKLPALGEGIGKMLKGFKKEMKSIEDEKVASAEKVIERGDDRDAIEVTPKGASETK
ncbi:MAG: twin-arginine translocase TatA/TatE family subunit [Deltaproteobacteria bacterium]|nr:twin-arginine translocase TatA/TatE family subunit [Deltaproteobacteria bacterium]MBK8238170.1 twin-arginine translocase TatA/TatE family subunit [Deltaproteobacteria bacterium]MBK8718486.1 twin-arginine translocase TatA/TatE family subunit [Deltaproteobacteria bacterium]MBP7288549.1 twin-arginine translocase TatA/TatE family subunit [Nannocystaceae bacterium]